jgi:hypothetical protein
VEKRGVVTKSAGEPKVFHEFGRYGNPATTLTGLIAAAIEGDLASAVNLYRVSELVPISGTAELPVAQPTQAGGSALASFGNPEPTPLRRLSTGQVEWCPA